MQVDFGVDFGTTNSACVGIIDRKRLLKFADDDGSPFPSLVILDPLTGQVFCGREAWMKRQEYSENCEVINSVKTYLGTGKTWRIAGKTWTTEMVAAEVFKGLKKQVSLSGGNIDMKEAIVAVPVGFAPEKRVELRRAAARAGIEINSFVSEPTAAFFRHLEEIGSYNKVGVVDWGGGTLDVSIIENSSGLIKELATNGLNLGGDNIDLKMANWIHNMVSRDRAVSIAYEEMPSIARDMLIARCERAKKDLSFRDVVDISLNKYGDIGPFRITLDIDTFTSLVEWEVKKAVECFEETLKMARISIDELGCILMVGGSVNLRPFIESVEGKWEKCEKVYPEDADWSVARGAGYLSINPGQYLLGETLGLIMSDSSFYPLFKEGSIVSHQPVNYSFALVEDSNTANFIFSDKNLRILGYMNVPSFGFFQEKIDLEAYIDRDLILKVRSKSQRRSKRYSEEWVYPGTKLYYRLPIRPGVVTSA